MLVGEPGFEPGTSSSPKLLPGEFAHDQAPVLLAVARGHVAQLNVPATMKVLAAEPYDCISGRHIGNDCVNFMIQVSSVSLSALCEIKRDSTLTVRGTSPGVFDLDALEPFAAIEHQVIPTVARRPTGDPAFFNRALQDAE